MALSNTDLFIVQNSEDKQHYKLSLLALKNEISAGDGATSFKGLADLEQAPADQGISAPQNGDMYIVENTTASIDAGWTIDGNPTDATAGDQILYYADGATWYLFSPDGGGGGGVLEVKGVAPIEVGGTASSPEVSILPALKSDDTSRPANSTEGSVKGLATAADVADNVVGGDDELVVTADLLVTTNKRIKVIEDNGGGNGGIVGDYVKTIAEGTDDVNNLTGVLTLTNTDGDYTIQVKKEQFAPYDFSALTDISGAP